MEPDIADGTEDSSETEHVPISQKQPEQRIIHFQPSRRNLLKASMTSFSFLLLIPLLASLHYNVSEFLSLEESLDSIGTSL
ncbi:hypothetical protein, partial [Tritonibacter sp. SIMBA_163]|uniref:hypothetical protein n=1 Tax=Tritonibacter sp. SIMBA_163 TaxID=3080868 RepID=UPI00398067C8